MTGWKIDIKSETDARELGIYPRFEEEQTEVEYDEESEQVDVYSDDETTLDSTEESEEIDADSIDLYSDEHQ